MSFDFDQRERLALNGLVLLRPACANSLMASPRSAGLLIYRLRAGQIEFLLAHPGGPYWRGRDLGAWSIPKGVVQEGEDGLAAARREFVEETALEPPLDLEPLTPQRQAGGKTVLAWLGEADLDLTIAKSETFEMEWPPRSGRRATFPEVDRFAYFPLPEALRKVLSGQAPILSEAGARISGRAIKS